MFRSICVSLLTIFLLLGNSSGQMLTASSGRSAPEARTGTAQKLVVASGQSTLALDLARLNGRRKGGEQLSSTGITFDLAPDSLWSILVFNDELRGSLPGTLSLKQRGYVALPGKLGMASHQLVLERAGSTDAYEFVVRDGQTGFTFFNVEGHRFVYDPAGRSLVVDGGRLLLSPEYAADLGRPAEAGTVVGSFSLTAAMQPVEITQVVDGAVKANVLPAMRNPEAGSVPGPDVVVGDLFNLSQFGAASGTQVGLAVGTSSCNFGTENLRWLALPSNDHPVIPQNLYRMSGGATNDERFEQIGQSSVKHAFEALAENICGLGCNGVSGTQLGSGCSDPYTASLNAGPNLGSRAWINPFTGAFPRSDSPTPPNSHAGHTHNGTSHRILTEIADLNTSLNPGATYYAESLYVTPHEYEWCTTHPTQCNMNNNVSYRRYNVTGTGSPFTFSAVGTTVRQKAAIDAWTGATLVNIQPDPANDGVAILGYKVTNPSAGVWHYEYAIYNQNLDRAINSFTLPSAVGATMTNMGFHSPPQHPGSANDGTVGSAGYDNFPWSVTFQSGTVNWSAETLAQNPNTNAIRWGTLYNFRFDSNRPPRTVNATIGFFKTGAPITVPVQAPSAAVQNATVNGTVNANGRPVVNTVVTMTDGVITRTAVTNNFGLFTFDNVVGGSYTFSLANKRYAFAPQTVSITESLTSLIFTALP